MKHDKAINEGDNMKKKLINFSAAALSVMLLTSCTSGTDIPKTPTQTVPETEAETEKETETTPGETHVKTYEDIDSQLTFIAGKYDELVEDYAQDETVMPHAFCAITDLNHNGRLEVLLTSCMGSGAYSYTTVYEISKDYTDLVKITYIDGSTEDYEDAADLCQWRVDEANIQVYDCYMKNGKYYYLFEDYASAGWTDKYLGFYSYSFGDKIRKEFIAGSAVHVDDGDYAIKTVLYKTAFTRVTNDEYFDYINSYWDGYEKQKSCEVKWIVFSDAANFADNIKDSWKAFNPDSDKSSDVNFDFRSYFRSFYGDEYKFEVQE